MERRPVPGQGDHPRFRNPAWQPGDWTRAALRVMQLGLSLRRPWPDTGTRLTGNATATLPRTVQYQVPTALCLMDDTRKASRLCSRPLCSLLFIHSRPTALQAACTRLTLRQIGVHGATRAK